MADGDTVTFVVGCPVGLKDGLIFGKLVDVDFTEGMADGDTVTFVVGCPVGLNDASMIGDLVDVSLNKGEDLLVILDWGTIS